MSTHDPLEGQLAALASRVSHLEREVALLREGRPSAPMHESAPRRSPDEETNEAAARGLRVASSGTLRASRGGRPSLESRIGSQLFNRIGILALLIGAAWFLKFAIDEHWLGPLARVLVGLSAGLGLVGWSEWFRGRQYRAFSYSLKALGTGILYLTLWAAYTLFALIPASGAFVAMVLVTAINAWLCWRQNSEVLAFYAAIGGLLTPTLLWTAESNELTLFTYLLLLDVAVLALVALRPWSRLLLVAFFGTAVYAVGWYVQHYTAALLGVTATFVVAFFLLFTAAPQMLRNLRLASAAATLTFEDNLALLLLPLLNGLLAFAELYALLSEPANQELRPWVAIAFAAFYFGMLWLARSPRLAGTPSRLQDTYLLLCAAACTGAVPLACDGHLIAVCWSAESVLLLVLAWRLQIGLLRTMGAAVLCLALIATVTLHSGLHEPSSVLLNQRFATYLAASAAAAFAAWLAGRSSPPESAHEWQWTGLLGSTGATLVLMIGVCLEISTYWSSRLQMANPERRIEEQFSYSAWSMLFGAVLLAAGFWRRRSTLRWQGLVLLALSIGKVFLVDLRELSQGYRIVSFLGLGAMLLTVSFVYQRDLLKLRER